MGKLAIYKYFSFMILVITIMMSVFTFFGLFGGNANPAHETAMSLIVLLLPFFIAGNIITLIFWLIRLRWHWAAIPFLTLLFCIPYVGTFYQPSLFSSNDERQGDFKIASYNVALFGREITGFRADDILSEMREQHVSILCLQEYMEQSGDRDNTASYQSYFGHTAMGRNDMVIFSQFPIKASGIIDFGATNNSGMWADIDMKGKLIRIYNVHLETTGFNRTLHKAAKQRMEHDSPLQNSIILNAIYGNFTRGMAVRAGQANIIARHISDCKIPIIVCGDFNDVPYSYTYRTMKGDLVDGFTECGKGFMSTLRGDKRVRIDYIFHDESFHGIEYYKKELSYSDHDPVFMSIAF